MSEDGFSPDSEPTGHLLAVMAHSLLNSVSAIKTAAALLERHRRLDAHQLDTVADVIHTQIDHVREMLKDLVRTGDPALMSTLDDLDRRRRAPSEKS